MKIPHVIKVFGYMYQLTKRNLSAYLNPIKIPNTEKIINNSVHWVGHATTVINLNGKILITDPVDGNLGFIRRLVKPSIDITKINADYILITHCHMDHLRYTTLIRMNKKAVVIVPHGIKRILNIIGFKNVIEMENGQIYNKAYIKIKCIKAKHKGNRYPLFGNKRSNSYLISSGDKSILFTGDTAYSKAYQGIKTDAVVIPVGCYKPDEYLSMHCSPNQAFDMFKMTICNVMIPIHYKTYILAQDNDNDTLDTLRKLNDGSIKIIKVGQTIEIN